MVILPYRRLLAPATWRHIVVLLLYLVLTVVMTWPLVLNLTTAIPGDDFDGWQNYWNQWWIKIALVERQQTPFVTDLLYHPTGVGLYFHTLNPFNGLVTLPVQLSLGLIPAYNAVVLFSWVLGGYGVYLLTQWVLHSTLAITRSQIRLPRSVLPAFFAGLAFTFSPFHMAHLLGHMQVMALQWIPFYALYLLRALHANRRGRPWLRSALMAGFFLALTGLCDWYFVLYLFFFTGIAVLWVFIQRLKEIGGRFDPIKTPLAALSALLAALLPAGVTGGVFLALLAPILAPMVREALQFSFMVRPATDLYILSASVMDFLVPNRLHTLFRPDSFSWIGNQVAPVSERTISIGYLPLALALVAVWRDRRRAAFWLVCAFFFLLLALGPRLHLGNITAGDIPAGDSVVERWTPYALLNRLIPFMRISRSVSRYALMVQLAIAVAAAVGLASLMSRRVLRSPGQVAVTGEHERRLRGKLGETTAPADRAGARLPLIAGVGACVLVLFEFWVAPYPISLPDTPPFYEQLRTLPDEGAVLNLPMNYDRPGYLLYQTVHQRPLTVAYISRDDPRTLTERAPVLQHFRHLGPDILHVDPATVGLTVLHDLDVAFVVLDRYKMPGGLEREYTEALASAIFAGPEPLYADERITVYCVPPPDAPQPYAVLGALNWGPRRQTADGRVQRTVGDAPALLHLHHTAAGTLLRIQYRTEPGVRLRVALPEVGLTLAELPPAPEGNNTTVAIGAADTILFIAGSPAGVQVEALEVLPPE
ncbi:MAG: hypothetical protein DCC55_27270 [Chloroflexi bacterium]|nr:MAG: hypothetical protein DCC55_27270 [Chloroflexota bacterium]